MTRIALIAALVAALAAGWQSYRLNLAQAALSDAQARVAAQAGQLKAQLVTLEAERVRAARVQDLARSSAEAHARINQATNNGDKADEADLALMRDIAALLGGVQP